MNHRRRTTTGGFVALLLVACGVDGVVGGNETPPGAARPFSEGSFDVIVYGGTSGGITAAIQAARMGKRVALIEPTKHLGGLTTNGLSKTDVLWKDAIDGLSLEFYQRVGQQYGRSEPEWLFEPHVAEQVYKDWLQQEAVSVFYALRLDRTSGVEKVGDRIASIKMEGGKRLFAKMFIDAGYEGDLLAAAGVTYTVGREANSDYGETYNGIQKAWAVKHQFDVNVDPYVIPGQPTSGLLAGISPQPPGKDGQGDSRVQAYNFRLIVTTDPSNRRPWTKPAGYDPSRYELLRRYLAASGETSLNKLLKLDLLCSGQKYDVNNRGAVSTDNIGANYGYPDGDYLTREAIVKAHRAYQQGLLYFLATDPRVPQKLRNEMNRYGLTYDEFADNDGWSGQIYVREARRMGGAYLMTDRNIMLGEQVPDPVGLGTYTMDSHNTRRYVDAGGHVRNEGDLGIRIPRPYGISYRSLTPRAAEVSNLLVTSAVSASHIAYGSIRMEPTFMILGQAAGTAACLAIDNDTSVQQVSYAELHDQLISDDLLPIWSVDIVDDGDLGYRDGGFVKSTSTGGHAGDYRHDNNTGGGAWAQFKLPAALEDGKYKIFVWWRAHPNRATNATVRIYHKHGAENNAFGSYDDLVVDMSKGNAASGQWHRVGGLFDMDESDYVGIVNDNADGYVISDAVKYVMVQAGGTTQQPNEVIIDNNDPSVHVVGDWQESTYDGGFKYGASYLHDKDSRGSPEKYVQWRPNVSGTYQVFLTWLPHANRASNTFVVVKHNGQRWTTTIDQRQEPGGDHWRYLGTFDFSPVGLEYVAVKNFHDDQTTADGYVIADAVKLVRQ